MKRVAWVLGALVMGLILVSFTSSAVRAAESCKSKIERVDKWLANTKSLKTKKDEVREDRNAGQKSLEKGDEKTCIRKLDEAIKKLNKLDPL